MGDNVTCCWLVNSTHVIAVPAADMYRVPSVLSGLYSSPTGNSSVINI